MHNTHNQNSANNRAQLGFPHGTEHFAYKNGTLYVEDVAITDIAQNSISTPFYVYSANTISHNFKSFQQAFAKHNMLIAYAVKASSNQALLTLLAKQGAGADIVSGGELIRALKAGIAPHKIVYSGVGKTAAEMDLALENQIFCFNVESFAELYQLAERARLKGVKAPISLRINPDIDAGSHEKITTGKAENKFGIPHHQAQEAYALAASLETLEICGVDVHIGSQIEHAEPFERAFAFAANLVKDLRAHGFPIKHLDIGGGLGIAYKANQQAPITPARYAALVDKYLSDLELSFVAEPGRFIVGNAGALIAQVLSIKEAETKRFVITDTGMNDLIRPTLYDAWHEIIPVKASQDADKRYTCDIVGPVCETGDFLALNRQMPNIAPNDLLAVMSCGAYGASMADNYNSRLTVPEVLVDGTNIAIIRPRESYDALLSKDKLPDWL